MKFHLTSLNKTYKLFLFTPQFSITLGSIVNQFLDSVLHFYFLFYPIFFVPVLPPQCLVRNLNFFAVKFPHFNYIKEYLFPQDTFNYRVIVFCRPHIEFQYHLCSSPELIIVYCSNYCEIFFTFLSFFQAIIAFFFEIILFYLIFLRSPFQFVHWLLIHFCLIRNNLQFLLLILELITLNFHNTD